VVHIGGDYIEGMLVCLNQVIKSFQDYRGVATTFFPALVCAFRWKTRPKELELDCNDSLLKIFSSWRCHLTGNAKISVQIYL
jgi:hypothetical protein